MYLYLNKSGQFYTCFITKRFIISPKLILIRIILESKASLKLYRAKVHICSRYSEKARPRNVKTKWKIFFKFVWPSQNI